MSRKKKEYNRIKVLKKVSRDETGPYGKAGIHADKRERRLRRMSTKDYLEEYEELDMDEPMEESDNEQTEGD